MVCFFSLFYFSLFLFSCLVVFEVGVCFERASSVFGGGLCDFCLVLLLFRGIEESEVRTLKVLGR